MAEEKKATVAVGQGENDLTIVGIQQVKKKDGSGYATKLFFEQPYSDYDRENGECLGKKTSDEYCSNYDCSGLKIGDIVNVFCVKRGQYLVVSDIRVVGHID